MTSIGAILRVKLSRLTSKREYLSLIKQVSGAFVVNIFGIGVALLCQVVLARLMTLSDFGYYAFIQTWIALLAVIVIMGTDTSSIKYLAKYLGDGESNKVNGFLLYAVSRVGMRCGVAIALGGLLIAVFSKRIPISIESAVIAAFLLPVFAVMQFGCCSLYGLSRVIVSDLISAIARPLTILLASVSIVIWMDVALTLGHVLILNLTVTLMCTGAVAYMLWVAAIDKNSECSFEGKDQWRSASLAIFGSSVSQALLRQIDIIAVGIILGPESVAVYAVASRITSLVTFGIIAANKVLAPTISTLYANSEIEKLQTTITFTSRSVLIYAIPVTVLFMIIGEWLLGYYGLQYITGYSVLVIMSIGQLVVSLCGSVGFLLNMTGHHSIAVKVAFGSVCVTVILVCILTPMMGMVGAALGATAGVCTRSLGQAIAVRNILKINPTAY
jgi:O-antigen/teichoic acid export membrane protein